MSLCPACPARIQGLEAAVRSPGRRGIHPEPARARQRAVLSEHLSACDAYAEQARSARLAGVLADLQEVIHILATAMGGAS